VIHTKQVQHPVKHQDFDFFREGVTERGRLFRCTVNRNGDFAQKTTGHSGREREHVGRVVVA
jgi:hypothetical protein